MKFKATAKPRDYVADEIVRMLQERRANSYERRVPIGEIRRHVKSAYESSGLPLPKRYDTDPHVNFSTLGLIHEGVLSGGETTMVPITPTTFEAGFYLSPKGQKMKLPERFRRSDSKA